MNNAGLLKEILQFGKVRRLNKTETRFTTEDGLRCIETQDESGEYHLTHIEGADTLGYVADTNPDLQVGHILPGLLLSSVDVAGDIELLEKLNVTHVLNITSMKVEYFPGRFTYKHVKMMDLECTKIDRYLPECLDFIDSALNNKNASTRIEPSLTKDSTDGVNAAESSTNGCVLVHCMAGISRSSTIVIAYLIARRGWTFEAAYEHVKSVRPTIKPNAGFMEQLKVLKPEKIEGVGENEGNETGEHK